MNTETEFQNVQSRINSLLLRAPRKQRTYAWVALYYAQPNPLDRIGVLNYQRKFKAYAAEGTSEFLTNIEGLVTELIRLAGSVRAEKSVSTAAALPVNLPTHFFLDTMHPKSRRLSDLRSKRNQRLCWAGYFTTKGKPAEAQVQRDKAAELDRHIAALSR